MIEDPAGARGQAPRANRLDVREPRAPPEVGEETGALADMLTRIANTYDDEVDNAVAGMTAAIEPALIIVLAVVVDTIVIAMFLPMVKIIGSVSGAAG